MNQYLEFLQEETFQTMMEYFLGKRYGISQSIPHSLIKTDIGAWISIGVGEAKGGVETTILKKGTGNIINFSFNFARKYVLVGLCLAS